MVCNVQNLLGLFIVRTLDRSAYAKMLDCLVRGITHPVRAVLVSVILPAVFYAIPGDLGIHARGIGYKGVALVCAVVITRDATRVDEVGIEVRMRVGGAWDTGS